MRSVILVRCLLLLLVLLVAGTAQAAGYIEFRGQRFVPTLGPMSGSVGIGFDPVNQRVLSVAETDVCGNNVINRAGNNGVAWDPVNQEFWMINANREVYRFDANNQPDVIFQIPATFNVPGVGVETLYSPQGLAVDMDHVYVVDFGPNIGETNSNQWFKFTRAGTPVSSSALTDFNVNLQAHTDSFGDATVDGIMWVPPGAPMDEGLFYVAVEHTGIMVLDANGMFVSNFLWTEHGLTNGQHVPFAFAGITMDPTTGDLYFVENAGEGTHVWLRLPDGPQSIIHGVAGDQIHGPDVRCARPTISNPPENFFSLTYRNADGLLWTNEFSSGEVFTLDPLTGIATSRGMMGFGDVWGMAYDEERDRIYVYQEFPRQLYVLDPADLNTTPLGSNPGFVRELAFNSDDNFIYGVEWSNPAMLARFDRDTGVRTDVGPTIKVGGIAYDPLTGMLVGHDAATTLYNIDPATGQAQIRAQLPAAGGWEGLAVIPAGPVVTAVGPTGSTIGRPTLVLQTYPNPLSTRSSISFELARGDHVSASVYDVAGRRVSQLFDGSLGAGSHLLPWDGRDGGGRAVASGTYFVELRTSTMRSTAKLTIMR